MKENIEDYRKNGFINLDEYLLNNPEDFTYPYYIDGYGQKNFWTIVGKEDKEKSVYVKPRDYDFLDNEYSAYAELIYSELLKQVGIDTANIDMAYFDGYPATITENVLEDLPIDNFIINSEDLLQSRCYNADQNTNIEDLYDVIHEYCITENLNDKIECKCIEDIQKICISDIFTLATSRTPSDFDFIAGVDRDGEEILKIAPSCHNTYSLGSCFSKDEMIDMLDDIDEMEQRVGLCYTDTGIPEYRRNYEYPYWEDSLYYFIDENESNLEFAQECAMKMNIDNAIKTVEKKIKSDIPQEYKDFVRAAFDIRTRQICTVLDLDYYKIMDNKYYEYEMEER